ncbi:MAG TPA: hypothetical protein V6D20_18775, partial [Candidatus Obscuribacterales bacterium]
MSGIIKAGQLQGASGAPFEIDKTQQGIAKAWVNFNGTGVVAIRDSFNVSSITDVATGTYEVNYATARPSANNAVAAT